MLEEGGDMGYGQDLYYFMRKSGPVSAPDFPQPLPENRVKRPDLGVLGNPSLIAPIAKIHDYIPPKRPPRSGRVFISGILLPIRVPIGPKKGHGGPLIAGSESGGFTGLFPPESCGILVFSHVGDGVTTGSRRF
jgi:hypothetical protein